MVQIMTPPVLKTPIPDRTDQQGTPVTVDTAPYFEQVDTQELVFDSTGPSLGLAAADIFATGSFPCFISVEVDMPASTPAAANIFNTSAGIMRLTHQTDGLIRFQMAASNIQFGPLTAGPHTILLELLDANSARVTVDGIDVTDGTNTSEVGEMGVGAIGSTFQQTGGFNGVIKNFNLNDEHLWEINEGPATSEFVDSIGGENLTQVNINDGDWRVAQ